MIIFLYGKDSYRLREKVGELVAGYRKKHPSGLNLVFLDEKTSFREVYDQERQVSMFNEKRLIVVPNVIENENFKKDFLQKKEKLLATDNIIILFYEGEVKASDKLLSFFLKEKKKNSRQVMCQEFEVLSESKLKSWIKKRFEENKVRVEEEVVSALSRMGGNDLWRIKSEVDKLSLYKKEIKKEDMDLLVSVDMEANIFKTIDALAQRESRKAALSLYNHLQKGDNPHYLLAMIAYQLRNLIAVSYLISEGLSYEEAKKKAALHPYVFQKTYRQAESFSLEELEHLYSKLFEIDLKTKTGQLDPALGLHLFLFEIFSPCPRTEA